MPLIVLLFAHNTPLTANELVRCNRTQMVGAVLSAVTKAPLVLVVANASPLVPRAQAVFFRFLSSDCDVKTNPCCVAKDWPVESELSSLVVVYIASAVASTWT